MLQDNEQFPVRWWYRAVGFINNFDLIALPYWYAWKLNQWLSLLSYCIYSSTAIKYHVALI